MDFFEYLKDIYGNNEPILSSEIEYEDYSKSWIYKKLAELCQTGLLIRFEQGVYYIPNNTLLGPSRLNPMKVIEKKYLSNSQDTFGYYSGFCFLNQLGLTNQVPNVIEIYTNSENSKNREVFVGNIRVVLRKSRNEIHRDNVAVQSFLELMNSVTVSYLNDIDRKRKIKEYIRVNNIRKKDITKYARVFPDKAIRTLVESEIIYDIA